MTDLTKYLPSDEEINEICNEDDNPDYQPGEFSFVTNPNLVRRLIEREVLKGQIEERQMRDECRTSQLTGKPISCHPEGRCKRCQRLAELHARLSELEAEHE